MKLILCPKCHDIRKPYVGTAIKCRCGKSWGMYLKDGLNMTYGGLAVPIGVLNSELADAMVHRPTGGLGKRFTAFVIPRDCDTCKFVESARGTN